MTLDPRRLLRLPPRPRLWPRRAYDLVVTLVLVVVVALIVALKVRPTEFPPTKAADQWAAEGAVFAAGAFLMAVLATAIATVAYINSTERPLVRVAVSHPGETDPWRASWVRDARDQSGEKTTRAEFDGWFLTLRLFNDGPVAARFVAIRVTFRDGAHLSVRRLESLRPCQAGSPRVTYARKERVFYTASVSWEGGADAAVHPSWEYDVPAYSRTKLALIGVQAQTTFRFEVEIVAHNVPAFKTVHTVHILEDK